MLVLFSCFIQLACSISFCPATSAERGHDQPDKAVPDLGTRRGGVDWPCFLGPKGTSESSEKGIVQTWSRDGLRLVWQLPLGSGYGMPVVSKGRLYQFDRVGTKARLRCLNSETGTALWEFEYPTDYQDFFGYNNGPRCSPVVNDGRVYIYGPEGMLHCLGAEDGSLLWKVDTKADFGVVQNFFGVGSTPAIEGDLLIAQVGGSPAGEGPVPSMRQKGNGSGIVAFDKKTGKIRYRITDELASYASPVMATIAGRRWCFVFARGGLVGFEPNSGKIDFQFPWRARVLESVNASDPLVVGDRVFISETYGPGSALLKVETGASHLVWSDADRRRDKALQCHWMTPIHVDGYIYGSSGRHTEEAELRCIELATGKVMWSEPGLTRSALLLVDGFLICLSETGPLRLLRVNSGKFDEVSRLDFVWEKKGGELLRLAPLLRPPCWAAPILSHGLLYVRGDNRLLCLELIPQ
ncbi:MAG TPA: PQQ-binding-like beta-propeller repeat protein [Gemmataceae bacterium]|nr:PQQ-binding-like beta-propeller repeat protein [Gemmataceae bacterium]